jgi:hypothetical protein
VNTFDANGKLLGDETPTSMPAGTPSSPAAAATGPTTVTFDLNSLLEPPYVYFVVAGIAFAAWWLKEHTK